MKTTLGSLRDIEARREDNDRHKDFLRVYWAIMTTDGVGEAENVAKVPRG